MGPGEHLLSPASHSHGRALNNDVAAEFIRNPNHRQDHESSLNTTTQAPKSFNHKTARESNMKGSISFERAYKATKQGYAAL